MFKSFYLSFCLVAFSSFSIAAPQAGLHVFTRQSATKWTPTQAGNYKSNQRIALVIHGWTDSLDSLLPLADFLTAPYDLVLGFQYKESEDPIEMISTSFLEAIDGVPEHNEVDVYASSMGGLIARYAVEQFGLESIKHLVLLATPEKGIPGIETVKQALTFAKMLELQLPSEAAFFQMFADQEPTSFLANLNKQNETFQPQTPYIAIQGGNPQTAYPPQVAPLKPIIAAFYAQHGMQHDGLIPFNDSASSCLHHRSKAFQGYITLPRLGHAEVSRGHPDLHAVLGDQIVAFRQAETQEAAASGK